MKIRPVVLYSGCELVHKNYMITFPDQLWLPPPLALALPDDEVHIWRAELDLPPARIDEFQRILAPDERSRAEKFYFERDRIHYTAGRSLLRMILGRYLQAEPGQIQFHYNAYGKPALAPAHGPGPLRFNLSHSGGLALYAFANSREIGVDVEHIRTDLDHAQIAAHTFSALENALLSSLPADVQPVAFFNCWTRKEAYIKAHGLGLSLPLDQFAVSLAPGEPARLLHTAGAPQEAERWSLQALAPGPGYAGALAAEGLAWHLKCWQWQ